MDGYKMIRGDINLDGTLPGILGKVETRLKPFLKLRISRTMTLSN